MEGRREGGGKGEGEVITNAYCLIRPPGHHAERDRGMGFCLFNNVALGALHAVAKHGLKRVAIVDYDVHHGNGTQASTTHPKYLQPHPILFIWLFFPAVFLPSLSLLPRLDAGLTHLPSLFSLLPSLLPSLLGSKPSTRIRPSSSSPYTRIATTPPGPATSRNGGRKGGRALPSISLFLRGVDTRLTFRRSTVWCCRRFG